MRIDKYLKVSRIIKRRTVAKDIVDADRIYVNDRLAKPSHQLKIGDVITIHFGNKKVIIRVKALDEKVNKEAASSLYELISEEKINQE